MKQVNSDSEPIIAWLGQKPTTGFIVDGPLHPATSRGDFLGQDNSDPAAKGERIFTDFNNLPMAVATILNHTMNKADFHPETQPPGQLSLALKRYVYELSQMPFFHKEFHDTVPGRIDSKDYNILINNIVALYKDFPPAYLEDIKISIGNMARSVFANVNGEGYINLFAAFTISVVNNARPVVMIYESRLRMYHGTNGKEEVSIQEYTVNRNIYDISYEIIKANAALLTSLMTTSVFKWIQNVTSPEEENKKLCFRLRPFNTGTAQR